MTDDLLGRLSDDQAIFTRDEVLAIVDIQLRKDEHKRAIELLESGITERQRARMAQIEERRMRSRSMRDARKGDADK